VIFCCRHQNWMANTILRFRPNSQLNEANSTCGGFSELTSFSKCARSIRLSMLSAALLVLCPLVIATRLEPAKAGLGTHHQLGLPACTVRLIWGVRCPSCGMTTSWAHLVRGQIGDSLRCNAGGTGLGIVALTSAMVLGGHAIIGRVPTRAWAIALTWSVAISIGLAVADWVCRWSTGGLQ
jgi:hypothetical protein